MGAQLAAQGAHLFIARAHAQNASLRPAGTSGNTDTSDHSGSFATRQSHLQVVVRPKRSSTVLEHAPLIVRSSHP